jgi:hypothetical protein
MRRITKEQASSYIPIQTGDPLFEDKAVAFSLTPDPKNPKYDLVTYYEENPYLPDGTLKPIEFVYVLKNKNMPHLVKIGMTVRDVDTRAREISGATGVPTPWVPVFSFKCYNSYKLEQEIHEYLSGLRESSNREMFNMSIEDAIEVVKSLGEKYTVSPIIN